MGKTFVTVALLNKLNQQGKLTAAYKPVAAGCEQTEQGLRNEDALALQTNSSIKLEYPEVNPIALQAAIAPHIAAKQPINGQEPKPISIDAIREGVNQLLQKKPDVLLIEGAGGWRLPLGDDFDGQPRYLSDVVAELNLAVILVVGMRLGCLNHAVLTAESIRNDGLTIAGWVANQVDPDMPYLDENIESLKGLLDAPFLGLLPQLESPADAGDSLDISVLTN